MIDPRASIRYAGYSRMMCYVAVFLIGASVLLHGIAIVFTLLNLNSAEYAEGPLMAFMMRWQHQPVEASWFSEVPLTTNAYGPMFFWGWKCLTMIWPSYDLLILGRFLGFASAFGICCAVAVASFHETRSFVTAGIAVLCLVSASEISKWFPYARVDTTASFLVCVAYLLPDGSRKRSVLAALALILASAARQSAVLHTIPLVLVTWNAFGSRRAREFITVLAVFGLLLWVPIWLWNENYFWKATITVHLMPLSIKQLWRITFPYLMTPASLTSLYALWLGMDRRILSNRWYSGFIWSIVISCILSLKAGSNTNYFMDAAWLGSIIISIQAAKILKNRPGLGLTGIAIAAGFTIVAGIPRLIHSARPTPAALQTRINSFVSHRPTLADGDLTPGVLRAGGTILVSDPFLFSRLVEDGSNTDKSVISRLTKDSVVILSHSIPWHREAAGFWPPTVLDFLSTHFCLSSSENGIYVYQPISSLQCQTSVQRRE